MCILIFTLIFILFSVPKFNPVIQNKTKQKKNMKNYLDKKQYKSQIIRSPRDM